MKLAFLRITRRRVSQLVALSVAVAVTASTAAVAGGVTSSQHAQKADAFSLAPFIAKVKAYQKPSTKWQGPTTPVTPPTTKFKVVGISCYSILHGCITPLVGAQHAAQALGWSMTILDGKGDPTVWAKDMDQAINSGANVIILGAVDGDLIKPQLAKAKAKGIIVVSTSNASAPGEQGFVLDTMVNMVTVGKMLADWMIVQTGGKGPILPYWDALRAQALYDLQDLHARELRRHPGRDDTGPERRRETPIALRRQVHLVHVRPGARVGRPGDRQRRNEERPRCQRTRRRR
jgi:ribose transport system substrate-binding protein